MARQARHRRGAGALAPGSLYHITSRGVDRADIFRSALDRVVFLGILADLCLELGLQVHTFCLMTNHFHMLLEDNRGQLSQLMNRLLSTYARYFNATRSPVRTGHLFSERFFSEVVTSRRYYDELAAYIVLNPLRTQTPLVASPELYPWSSARLAVEPDTNSEAWCSHLLDGFGGIEEVLAALPRTRAAQSRSNRRRRLEALASGRWLDVSGVRAGRPPAQYRDVLARHLVLLC